MSGASDFQIQNGVLKKYTGPGGEVTIPEGVKAIDRYAFYECGSVTSVELPESVTSIVGWAFRECDNLARITIPAGVTEIGDSAFYGCSSLVDISLPAGLREIKNAAFFRCMSLPGILIPESVKTIGRSAFSKCYALTDIALPDSVTHIGKSAFAYCAKLTNLSILGSLEWIGEDAFAGTRSLEYAFAPKTPLERFKEQDLAMPAIMGYIQNTEAYIDPQIAVGYQKYLFANKRKLLPYIFRQDLVQVVELLAKAGRIQAKDFDELFLQPAQAANAFQCVAFLLEHRGKHMSAGYAERQLLNELDNI